MPKRILFVLHMPPPVHGAAMVGKSISESTLINGTFECRYINLSTSYTVESVGKFSMAKIRNSLRIRRMILQAISDFHPDLVYYTPSATGFAFWKDFHVTRAIKRTGTPLLLHFHNKGVQRNGGKWLYDKAYRRFFSGTEVILLSQSLYGDIGQYVTKEHVHFCGNGIAGTVADGRHAGSTEGEPMRLLFLSNIIRDKGFVVLLDACERLHRQRHGFVCNIVGSETQEFTAERIQQEIARRGLTDRVHYLGRQYGEQKEAIYGSSDLFVFPTFYGNECFPLVLLEAMEHALPCITTREGACADIVEDGVTGLIVKRRDSADLAGKILTLMEDRGRCRALGEAGRRKFDRCYTLQIFEQNLCEILTSISNR